jgi:hypothetical protein
MGRLRQQVALKAPLQTATGNDTTETTTFADAANEPSHGQAIRRPCLLHFQPLPRLYRTFGSWRKTSACHYFPNGNKKLIGRFGR